MRELVRDRETEREKERKRERSLESKLVRERERNRNLWKGSRAWRCGAHVCVREKEWNLESKLVCVCEREKEEPVEGVACVELLEHEPQRTLVLLDCFYNSTRVEEASRHTLVA